MFPIYESDKRSKLISSLSLSHVIANVLRLFPSIRSTIPLLQNKKEEEEEDAHMCMCTHISSHTHTVSQKGREESVNVGVVLIIGSRLMRLIEQHRSIPVVLPSTYMPRPNEDNSTIARTFKPLHPGGTLSTCEQAWHFCESDVDVVAVIFISVSRTRHVRLFESESSFSVVSSHVVGSDHVGTTSPYPHQAL